MNSNKLEGIRACVFDAYGTLFDVHSAVGKHRQRLGDTADAVSELWRAKQLAYTWLRSLMGAHTDFWHVTGDALEFALAAGGIQDNALKQDLMAAYLELDCYPEVPAALEELKQTGIQTAILSNGAPKMLAAAVENARIGRWLDRVLSVEEVGIFKPSPRVYRLAVDRLGLEANTICFLSSNAWDAAGAAAFGLRVIWVNRFDQPPERLPFHAEAEIASLSELPERLGI